MWVIPLNRENYARNEDYVYHLIDSLYYAHGEWIDNDDATFILPESFTRIDYTHGNVKITDSISCDIDNAFTDKIVSQSISIIRQVTKSVFLKIQFQTCRRQEFITSSNN